mgnify:CR=1 FL=1
MELVGLSFSFKEHTGYYVPVANDGEGKDGAKHILSLFKKLFELELFSLALNVALELGAALSELLPAGSYDDVNLLPASNLFFLK